MKKFTIPIVGAGIAALIGLIWSIPTENNIRAKIVKIALDEINDIKVSEYYANTLSSKDLLTPPKDWCGIFILWVLHKAGIAKNVKWKVGVGFIATENLIPTKTPKPGDIAYFTKNQHQALVKSVNDDGTVTIINGNGMGGKITVSSPKISDVATFYSIKKLMG